ncbi:MAG: Gfo/Idh/MocA family oxidoreductase [Planctomycetaceae bacterium]|nr:Gfo/Idh/MocA family oxidoreductase [Planctomycetaceae bacterium]
MKLRVGLVGLGNDWETRHRSALRALSDRFEVRAIYEPVGLRAEQAAREFNAVAVDGFRALAFREDVDAVLLLARQWYGSLPILAACDAGKAVYCASGLELDPVAALKIKQRVEAAGVAFMAEFPCRQAPATLRLKELIATRLGHPRLLFCHRRKPAEDSADLQRRNRPEPPRLLDLIELVDWCRYVVGSEPTSVFGIAHEKNPAVRGEEDYQMMSLDFSQSGPPGTGPVAQISCGRYVPAKWAEAVAFRPPAALQVACEQGIAFIDLPASLTWFDTAGRHQESLDSERPVGEQLLAQFYRAVTSLVRNTSSLEDAFRALTVVVKSQQSCEQGRRMMIPP